MAIGTTAALIGSAAIGAAGSAYSAKKAGDAQAGAAGQQLALQREMFGEQKAMFAPYLEAGGNALDAYKYEMGLGAAPGGYEGFTGTPGYDFRLKEGINAVNAGVGARHGLNSGSAMKALTRYGQNYASSEYGNHMNRLSGLANMGQNSAAMTGQAAQNNAMMGSNALANMGNAQAASAIGVGNAITGGINNGLGAWAYGKQNGWM